MFQLRKGRELRSDKEEEDDEEDDEEDEQEEEDDHDHDHDQEEEEGETAKDGTLEKPSDVYEVPSSTSNQQSAHDTHSSTDEQSSPLKTTRRSTGRKPQKEKSANPETTSAKQPAQRKPPQHPDSDEDTKQGILQSYRDCGLQPNVLFSAAKAPYAPTSIALASSGWRNARLTPPTMQRLRTRRDNLLKTHWITADNTDAVCNIEKRDIDLIRKLCDSPTSHAEEPGVLSAMHKFCRQSNNTQD
ncbi:hypothetical protein LTR37_020466 [Vermiconidia calcicola]|uniref:Uncharacterized protein n=1 Tax=Vermiconidia calcicola TaxID=1690605 RepID=A0ACC3MB58_9PEZI|nr:hypothetical protein LTR37_020466 [Vermiconidia calcicola]